MIRAALRVGPGQRSGHRASIGVGVKTIGISRPEWDGRNLERLNARKRSHFSRNSQAKPPMVDAVPALGRGPTTSRTFRLQRSCSDRLKTGRIGGLTSRHHLLTDCINFVMRHAEAGAARSCAWHCKIRCVRQSSQSWERCQCKVRGAAGWRPPNPLVSEFSQ